MTLNHISSSIKVGNFLFEPFDAVRGFRQGDLLSCGLFSFIAVILLRKFGVHCNDTIFCKRAQLFAYSDDIGIVGPTKLVITAASSAIEWQI